MALDCDRDSRITPEPFGLTPQCLLAFGLNIDLVVVEEHAVAGGRGQILLRPRAEPRAADAAWPHWPARPPCSGFRRMAAGGEQREPARDSDKASKHRRTPPQSIGNRNTLPGLPDISEARATMPDPKHRPGCRFRAGYRQSDRSNTAATMRPDRPSVPGENTSTRAHSAPRWVLRPENPGLAIARPSRPAA